MRKQVSRVDAAPRIAEKPYLVSEGAEWKILVPAVRSCGYRSHDRTVADALHWLQRLCR